MSEVLAEDFSNKDPFSLKWDIGPEAPPQRYMTGSDSKNSNWAELLEPCPAYLNTDTNLY